ncbi:MAG: hypothetical protein WC860_06140 [Candidatus Margulisiibacteriota bacterium]|jgi:hypothetical protein
MKIFLSILLIMVCFVVFTNGIFALGTFKKVIMRTQDSNGNLVKSISKVTATLGNGSNIHNKNYEFGSNPQNIDFKDGLIVNFVKVHDSYYNGCDLASYFFNGRTITADTLFIIYTVDSHNRRKNCTISYGSGENAQSGIVLVMKNFEI